MKSDGVTVLAAKRASYAGESALGIDLVVVGLSNEIAVYHQDMTLPSPQIHVTMR